MTKNDILIGLSESDKTKVSKEDFALQSLPQKVFSSVWAVESEVNNGGFSQYFLNSSAETAAFLVDALATIGAPKTADICRRAIECAFPGRLPPTAEDISALAAEFSEDTLAQLDSLDAEFLAYPHDLTELLYAYVSRHPEEFGTVPAPKLGQTWRRRQFETRPTRLPSLDAFALRPPILMTIKQFYWFEKGRRCKSSKRVQTGEANFNTLKTLDRKEAARAKSFVFKFES